MLRIFLLTSIISAKKIKKITTLVISPYSRDPFNLSKKLSNQMGRLKAAKSLASGFLVAQFTKPTPSLQKLMLVKRM